MSGDAARKYPKQGDFLDPREVEERVLAVLRDVDKIDKNKISSEATWASLGLDSLDQVELVIHIEEEFVIELEDKEAGHVHGVQDAVKLISNWPYAT